MEEDMDKKEVDLLGSLESESNKVEKSTDSYLGALDQLSTVDHGMKSVQGVVLVGKKQARAWGRVSTESGAHCGHSKIL